MTSPELMSVVRARRTWVLMVFDACALAFAYAVSVVLRYGPMLDTAVWSNALLIGMMAIALQWAGGLLGRVYLGRVGVATTEETVLLGTVTALAGLVVFCVNAVVDPLWIARSVPVSGTFLGLFIMLTVRAVWRQLTQPSNADSGGRERAIVVGAGASGSQLVHSMLSRPDAGMVPVGFLDDDPWKRKRRHFGVPVLGTLADLEDVVGATGAVAVVVAIPSATKEMIRPLMDRAAALGVSVKVLPPFAESFASRADVRDVRDVDMRDVLGRATIQTDLSSIAGYVTGRRVLVTGAGGSIGSELCRQLHRFGPEELIMLDRDESALHSVQLSIHGRALLDGSDVVLNDIRDEAALRQVFEDRKPEVVFHAAALKHLPILEQYPHEAMKTNVLGTANVLRAAADVGVVKFVNISTDKAADPSSVLGYSKRIAERMTASMAKEADGTYISVRFGNVLGSRGSVLHAFTAQIATGGPVTVTHPDVTRYFMTVEEAVQLVIQAGAIGEDGQVMILDMGEPVKIVDVARQLIDLSGKPIEIVYTGLREGEKLHENLFSGAEEVGTSQHPLVSHAPVAPLTPNAVRSYDVDSTHLGMLETFERWVHQPDPRATLAD